MLFRTGSLLLIAFMLVGGVAMTPAAHGASSASTSPKSTLGLDLRGTFAEKSVITGLVTGVPSPGPSGTPDEVLVAVKINGVTVELPSLTWNFNDGVWEFLYDIPAGSAGSVISISVMGPFGNTVSRTFTVTT